MYQFASVLVEFELEPLSSADRYQRGIDQRQCRYLLSWTRLGNFIVYAGAKNCSMSDEHIWMSASDPRKAWDSGYMFCKHLFEENIDKIGTISLFMPSSNQPVMTKSLKCELKHEVGQLGRAINAEDMRKWKRVTFRDLMHRYMQMASQAHPHAPYFV